MNICPVMSMYATELDCLRARDKWFMERVAQLERENEALRKDAERYRRLRDHTEYPPGEVRDDLYVHVDSVHAMDKWALSGADLDAFLDREIDAALKEQSKC